MQPLNTRNAGVVTRKSSLPIMGVQYQELQDHSHARFTVGKLKCKGTYEQSKIATSCKQLRYAFMITIKRWILN